MRMIIAMLAALSLAVSAHAAEPRVLQVGDVVNLSEYGQLNKPKIRILLREYGYRNIGYVDHFGDIVKTSGVAPDGKLYRLSIHTKTGLVTKAYRIRHVF